MDEINKIYKDLLWIDIQLNCWVKYKQYGFVWVVRLDYTTVYRKFYEDYTFIWNLRGNILLF